MKQISGLYRKCRKSDSSFILVFVKLIFNRIFYGKTLLLHQNVRIKGIKKIESTDKIEIGIGNIGFMHKSDKTFLNIRGKLRFKGPYSIGRGCRFDIGENALVTIGKGGYINGNSKLIIMHSLSIGDQCAISWDCQFLDEDFHKITYSGKRHHENGITIGNRVWIGCGVKIYKGTIIPDGCVIAADSAVRGVFHLENSLIGGNPAKVIKENISWT